MWSKKRRKYMKTLMDKITSPNVPLIDFDLVRLTKAILWGYERI